MLKIPVLNWEHQDKALVPLLPDVPGTSLCCPNLTLPRARSQEQEKQRNPWLGGCRGRKSRQALPPPSLAALELLSRDKDSSRKPSPLPGQPGKEGKRHCGRWERGWELQQAAEALRMPMGDLGWDTGRDSGIH